VSTIWVCPKVRGYGMILEPFYCSFYIFSNYFYSIYINIFFFLLTCFLFRRLLSLTEFVTRRQTKFSTLISLQHRSRSWYIWGGVGVNQLLDPYRLAASFGLILSKRCDTYARRSPWNQFKFTSRSHRCRHRKQWDIEDLAYHAVFRFILQQPNWSHDGHLHTARMKT
jgi:hypothetical protein